ncbi:MAG: response regulator [Bacteroidota bacterium]
MKNQDITILCVDDNTKNLEVISTILNEQGFRIALARSGEDALEVIHNEAIDLILLDIMMPGKYDGFEVCRILKEDPETKDIPILFITARTEVDDIVKGFNLGGNDYITKPFQKEELLARVKTHLKLSILMNQLHYRVDTLEKSRYELMSWLHDLSKTVG